MAQYVEKSEGASRVHAEISRGPAGYIIKDLDSRNGTLYQGNPMIPYKEYPLTEGSVFTIIKGSYTFRTA
ncbi:FHA domain protein [compost metagenome]